MSLLGPLPADVRPVIKERRPSFPFALVPSPPRLHHAFFQIGLSNLEGDLQACALDRLDIGRAGDVPVVPHATQTRRISTLDYQRFADEHHLVIEIEDRVACIRLNRPEKRNAIDHALHSGLESIWRKLGTDPNVGAIVITGEGKGFCAGGDVVGFYPEDPGPLEQMRGSRWLVQEMINCEAPVIAAVNGVAAGLGATIALLSDIIYMAEDARIGDTHVNMGLVAGDGGAVIWPLLIGPHRAKEFLMGGTLIEGPRAAEMGLVNHCVPGAELMERATEHARQLANGPQAAIRWTKLALNQQLRQSLNLAMDMGLAVEHLSIHTEDQKEAVASFIEKRVPKFTGR